MAHVGSPCQMAALTVPGGRICGKSSLYAILLADAATNNGLFHGNLAASARRTPCSGILPQMRPVGERMAVMGWMSVGKKGWQ